MSKEYNNPTDTNKETTTANIGGEKDAATKIEADKKNSDAPIPVPSEEVKAGNVIDVVVDNADDEDVSPVVKFTNKYNFEGRLIEEIDLSPLLELSGKDAKQIKKLYRKIADNPSVSPETTDEYAMAAASFITELPLEFFEQLRLNDLVKIRLRVINFIFSE